MAAENAKKQEDLDKEDLENYIMKLFNEQYVNAKIKKQISTFIEEYNYTYSGMKKALIYFYEVKKNDIAKANGGIGIIPYCYKQAYNYYYSLWLANQKNENKVIVQYVPTVREVRIPSPQLKQKRRKLFSFFEEDDK